MTQETTEQRMDRIEAHIERLEDTLKVIADLRRGETVESIIDDTVARIGPNFDGRVCTCPDDAGVDPKCPYHWNMR